MKKLLIIALIAGLGFTSCKKESIDEQINQNEVVVNGTTYQIDYLKGLAVKWFQRDESEIGYDRDLKAFYIHGYDNRWTLEEILPTLLYFEEN